jgi:hypothetical protein
MTLEPPTVDDRSIWDLWLSQYQLPVVVAADELGLFARLHAQPATLEPLAKELSLTARGAESLLAVLAALGYVIKQDGTFRLTDTARTYLLPESPFYWVPMLRRVGSGGMLAESLLASLRKDNLAAEDRVTVRWEKGGLTVEDAIRSNESFHCHSFPAALGVARNMDFSGVQRMLDVAGGPGSFSIALALRHPTLRCTVADLPTVVPDTANYIRRYQVDDRVDTHAFNMFEDTWPSDYDAVFFSNIFHDWDPDRRTELASRSFSMLPINGRIFIHEMLLNDAADGPLPAALFSIMMLNTRGKQFSFRELRDLLTTAGFADVDVTQTYGYYSVVSARRP